MSDTIFETVVLQRKTLSKNGKSVVYVLPGAHGILHTTLFINQQVAPETVEIRVPLGAFKVADTGKAQRAAEREARKVKRLANAEQRLQKMLARAAKLQADLDKRKALNPAQPDIIVAPVFSSDAAKDGVGGTATPYVSPLKAARKEASVARKERRLRGPMR